MKPVDIFNDGKHHHFVYFWGTEIEVDGTEYQEVLYIDGKSYIDPEEIHEVVEIDLGNSGSIDFGWHTSLSSLQQVLLETVYRVRKAVLT